MNESGKNTGGRAAGRNGGMCRWQPVLDDYNMRIRKCSSYGKYILDAISQEIKNIEMGKILNQDQQLTSWYCPVILITLRDV